MVYIYIQLLKHIYLCVYIYLLICVYMYIYMYVNNTHMIYICKSTYLTYMRYYIVSHTQANVTSSILRSSAVAFYYCYDDKFCHVHIVVSLIFINIIDFFVLHYHLPSDP